MKKQQKKWEPKEKPPPDICPEIYCSSWREKGDQHSPGFSKNLEAAMQRLEPIPQSHCGCSFGICTRLDPIKGKRDYYEPHEIFLENDGLPWFYFIPFPDKLIESSRKDYIESSEKLWGKKHWENNNG